jgi:hypothetical protein
VCCGLANGRARAVQTATYFQVIGADGSVIEEWQSWLEADKRRAALGAVRVQQVRRVIAGANVGVVEPD